MSGTGHRNPQCAGCGDAQPHSTAPDVAIITLDQPIFVSRYALLPEAGLADGVRRNQPLLVVGYGTQDVDPATKEFLDAFDGRRHRASVTLGRCRNELCELSQALSEAGKAQGGVCYIDSGGPALLEDTVLSVNSDVASPLCTGVSYG